MVEETLVSHLLKSNCLVTGQPDWGSVQIHYVGPQIDQEGLLQYLIGFRDHNEFHEQCVERIFMDILRQCRPQKLIGICPLYATRRLGHQSMAQQFHHRATSIESTQWHGSKTAAKNRKCYGKRRFVQYSRWKAFFE